MVGQLAYRVLIVDDAPIIRKTLSATLVAAGYVVRTAEDGLAAIGKLRGGPIDLVISDLQMPRMSGLEFLAVVRQRFPQVPVIAMSDEVASHGIPSGLAADIYFQKNGNGYGDLLQSASDLIRNPPGRAAVPEVDAKPKWAIWDGDGHYDLTCADCLRSLKVPCSGRSWRGEQTTTCLHCGGVVRFSADTIDTVTSEDSVRDGAPGASRNFGLTPREMQIIELIVAGYTDKDLAWKLGMSEPTAKQYIAKMVDKLRVFDRLELVLFAIYHQLINQR